MTNSHQGNGVGVNGCRGAELMINFLSSWLHQFKMEPISFAASMNIPHKVLFSFEKESNSSTKTILCGGCGIGREDDPSLSMENHFNTCDAFKKTLLRLIVLLLKKLISTFVKHEVPKEIQTRIFNLWNLFT